MLTSVSILLLCLGGDPVPAHKLTDLERAQRRLHAGDAELRKLRGELEGDIGRNGTGVVVIGKHNPELLMRWELINHIEGTLNSESHFTSFVPRWTERGAAKLLGDQYLNRLQKVMAPLVEAQKELARLNAQIKVLKGSEQATARQEWDRVMRSICPLRAQALAAARAEFGAEAFDRFLYEAVAPDSIITTSPNTPEDMADLASWLEGGCR